MTPEDRARANIDGLLTEAGWDVQDRKAANLTASSGVAIHWFPMRSGHGTSDYMLFVDGMAVDVVEAKPEGASLTGIEIQTKGGRRCALRL